MKVTAENVFLTALFTLYIDGTERFHKTFSAVNLDLLFRRIELLIVSIQFIIDSQGIRTVGYLVVLIEMVKLWVCVVRFRN